MNFSDINKKKLINGIESELANQDLLFPNQKHTIYKWLSIIGEELGELHKEALDINFRASFHNFYNELFQIITLCTRLLFTPYIINLKDNTIKF